MLDIGRAARASGWSVVDVVRAILDGRLARVECVDPDLRFAGVLVDPAEIRTVLAHAVSDDLIGVDEAVRLLGIKRYGMRRFLSLRDPPGAAYLVEQDIRNADGGRSRAFSRSRIMAFFKAHITLAEIASRLDTQPRWIKPKLDARGIKPIGPSAGIGRTFYRRSDLAALLPP